MKINGQTIPAPSSFVWELQPQSGAAERNAAGALLRETLPDKVKLSCEWKFSSSGAQTELLSLLKSLTEDFFTVTYPDPVTGSDVQITAYVSPISASLIKLNAGALWGGVKCSFVER